MSEIPNVIRQADLMVAIKPLLDLVGLDPREVYVNPPITVGDSVDITIHPDAAARMHPDDARTPVVVGEGEVSEHAFRISIPLDINLPTTPDPA